MTHSPFLSGVVFSPRQFRKVLLTLSHLSQMSLLQSPLRASRKSLTPEVHFVLKPRVLCLFSNIWNFRWPYNYLLCASTPLPHMHSRNKVHILIGSLFLKVLAVPSTAWYSISSCCNSDIRTPPGLSEFYPVPKSLRLKIVGNYSLFPALLIAKFSFPLKNQHYQPPCF